MKASLTEFNAYLINQIGEPYLWGGQHTKLTPTTYKDIIYKKETSEENAERVIAYCNKLFDLGATELFAYDCSGLGMYFLQNEKHIFDHDMNANRMMQNCEIVDEPKCGYWVFRLNDGKATHIGYMVTDTEVIHAKGRDCGVVRERYKKSYWHCVGKPNCIDFEEKPEPTPEPEPEYGYQIKVHGSVRVREGNGVLSKKICTVSNCRLPYLGQATESPYWYKTMVDGKEGYITSKPKYTEIVEVLL